MYRTILMDPPWNERGAGKVKRGADRHYPILSVRDILTVILDCPHWKQQLPNAHLYMWTTNTFLPDALWLMDALNFKYKSNFVWIKSKEGKLQQGLGQYFRGSHELCLFGTRGKKPTEPRTNAKNISSVIMAERTKHSSKPKESYELIERRSHGPYLELFARNNREKWMSWGNEIK